ncbi:thiamine-phosphate pyrophosphorylase [Bacillus pakistanensis]|uniref:Thiamine-phosphate synthase n=1 Tax=Rossellomorea pakistanensis TaxID=992288 RepID=A0ABS2ND56_9BACI|nr:thiamine phosphate synthase [Bacillus pakistanensis]MBM7585745.1 thiamine-phosphate pyrophosphorylase [Bacillus pakistanensis]
MKLKEQLELYFVMGSVNCDRDPREVLTEALEGGVTMFQFREKGEPCLEGEAKLELAKDLQKICQQFSVPFIVNDDVELALLLNADGVHVGQEDDDIEEVRRRIGTKLLGVSAHNVEEAKRAIALGADYLGVGPMFLTTTKADIRKVEGPNVLKKIRTAGITIPLVGIGGIKLNNASEVIQAGADGIAVISAISRVPGTARKMSNLLRARHDPEFVE